MPSSLLEMVDRQRARRRRHEEEAASGSTPSRLLPPLQPVRLIVENLPLCDFENAGLGNGGPSESFTSYSPSIDNAYLHAIPADALVSLRMAPPLPPMTNKLGGLKQLLLAARGLRTFHFQDRGQGTRFHFGREIEEEMEDAEADHMDEDYDSGLDSDESDLDFDEYAGNSPGRSSHETARRPLPRSSRQHLYHDRLPAFHDLSLRSYDWNHSPAVVARHWDLTQLRRLSLTSMPTHAFLSSVSLSQVGRHLRSLTLDDYSAHLPVDRRSEATALLAELLAVHVPMGQLEELRVTVRDAPSFPLRECIVRHADSLKVLAFRDHVGFRPDAGGGCGGAAGCGQVACPTLRARDVAMLAAAMRRVETLELDMDVAACDDVYAFQQAVASFPAVRDATLHVQTCLRPMGPELEEETGPLVAPRWPQEGYVGGSDGRGSSFGRSGPLWPPVDRDRDEAAGTFARLREFKRAAMVKAEARDEAVPPWRSITINVGGWSKIMVRRFGEGWRRHNERGLYAERCFTMNAAGEMSEEKSIES